MTNNQVKKHTRAVFPEVVDNAPLLPRWRPSGGGGKGSRAKLGGYKAVWRG